MQSSKSVQADTTADRETAAQRIEAQNGFPFLDSTCRVCKSPSTGVHYGVATCEGMYCICDSKNEDVITYWNDVCGKMNNFPFFRLVSTGCKGFFKRSIPKSQHYKCYFGGDCEINRETRNRCKACRFQRCVQVGMALEAVKMGRIPKGEKERAMRILEATSEERPAKCLKTLAPAVTASSCSIPVASFSSLTVPVSSVPVVGTSATSAFLAPISQPISLSNFVPASAPSTNRSQYSHLHTVAEDVRNSMDQDIDHWLSSVSPFHNSQPTIKTETVDLSGSYGGGWCVTDKPVAPSEVITKQCQHQEIPHYGSSANGHPKLMFCHSNPVHTPSGVIREVRRSETHAESFKRREISRSLSDGPRSSPGFNISRAISNGFRSIDNCLIDSLFLPAAPSLSRSGLMHCSNRTEPELEGFMPTPVSLSMPLTPSNASGNQPSASLSITDSGFDSRPESTFTSASYSFDIDLTDDQSFPDGNTTLSAVTPTASAHDPFNQSPGSFYQSMIKCSPTDQRAMTVAPVSIPRNTGTLLELVAAVNDTERAQLLVDVVAKIDAVGNDVYQQETSDSVEFMVKLWQEGRLNEAERINDPEITALVIRDHIKLSLDRIVNSIMHFASGLPGAKDLCETDFQRLLEQCVFEIWMIQYAAFLVNNESYIMLRSPERSIQYSRYWMSQFLPEIMIASIMKFADEINPCQFTFLELNILKAVVIACPGREGLSDVKQVQALRNMYQHVLYQVFERRGSALVAQEMMVKVNSLMPKLSALNDLHKKCIAPIVLDKDEQWKVDENNLH